MSLQQIKHIGSVGRFRAASAEGDVSFKKYTLIFGENGRGKSTLCSIFRSLQNDDPAIILGRKTLGGSKEPHIILKFADGSALFKDGVWNKPNANLRIFDATYVAENVYFSDEIGTDQRRNLCRVILGRDGVVLAKAYDDADAAITTKNNEIREIRKTLTVHVPTAQLEQFLALTPDPDVDAKIAAKAREVEGLKEIDTLRTRPLLQSLDCPPLPTRLEEILGTTLEDVSRHAEARVKNHLANHGMSGLEDWLSTGLAHTQDKDCPFCGQSLQGVDLIEAYKSYFNEAYTKFREELDKYAQLPIRHYSDDKIAILASRLEGNLSSADTWQRYCTFSSPQLSQDVAEVVSHFRDEMVKLLNEKRAAPFEKVNLTDFYRTNFARLSELTTSIHSYNSAVADSNKLIDAFKKSANPARLQSAQNELKWLQLSKKRHEKPLADSCDDYQKILKEKEDLDQTKAIARSKLDEYSSTVIDTHRKTINSLLKTFTAGFHLDRMKVEYSGRVPNTTFCVVINDTPVEVGKADTPLSEPSFRNTLSSGDKSTLALAFFLAQIKAEKSKNECVVVFDDPFNSQDQFRRTCTMGEIRRCGREVAQVIVMSHDARFLKDLWGQDIPTGERKALWLIPFGQKDTSIAEWSIETEAETEDTASRRVLLAYYHEGKGNARDVIQKLRPVVETHMKRMAPQLDKIKGFGAMLGKIRDDQSPQLLLEAYDDLDDINNYTRKYMHGEGASPDTEPVHTTELHGFVRKVLEIAGALVD